MYTLWYQSTALTGRPTVTTTTTKHNKMFGNIFTFDAHQGKNWSAIFEER